MPPRDPALYLADIVEAGRAIEGFLAGRSLDDFTGDDLLASAVHSKLIIIGEAAASLPAETRDAIPDVDWRAIVRFRNLVVHAYFVMNLERVFAEVLSSCPSWRGVDQHRGDEDMFPVTGCGAHGRAGDDVPTLACEAPED